jgi:predicted transcriptional regulator
MYGANLSYNLLTRYLAEILEACLVKFESKSGCYVLTEKGKRFLQHYREYSKRNRHVERQLETVNAKRKVLEELCSN